MVYERIMLSYSCKPSPQCGTLPDPVDRRNLDLGPPGGNSRFRVMRLTNEPHFSIYHQVLNRAVWSPRHLSEMLLALSMTYLDQDDIKFSASNKASTALYISAQILNETYPYQILIDISMSVFRLGQLS